MPDQRPTASLPSVSTARDGCYSDALGAHFHCPDPGAAFLTQSLTLEDGTAIKFEIWDTVSPPPRVTSQTR